jgi:amino acid transporter
VPGTGNVCAAVIQSWAVVINNSYVPKPYQLVLMTIFISSFAIVFNIYLARRLPGIEGTVFTLYMIMFFVVFVILLVMGPRSSAKEIFTDFQDNAGWGSIGTACFVGVSGPVITLIGADSSVHMAEELKDASKQLPRAMLCTAAVNYTIGFLMTVAAIAVVGDVAEILATPFGLPFVQVIYNATLSRNATIVIVALIIFFFFFCAINQNTTSSRQLYAFARDGGLPFSAWLSYVSSHFSAVPLKHSFFVTPTGSSDSPVMSMLTSTLGFSNAQHPRQCRHDILHHRIRPGLHSVRLIHCFLEHHLHWQRRSARFLHHLRQLPSLSPQLCRTVRPTSQEATLLPWQSQGKHH